MAPISSSRSTSGAVAAITQHVVITTSATTATPQRRYMLVPSVTMPMAALTDSVVSSDVDSSSGSATEPTAERSTPVSTAPPRRSEEHTSELQSRGHLVCRFLLEKKKHYFIK